MKEKKKDLFLPNPMYFFLGNFSSLEIMLCVSHCPRLLIDLCRTKQKHFVFGLCCSNVFLSGRGSHWVLYFDCNGTWQECCHLQTIALASHHQQWAVLHLAAGCWVTGVPVHRGLTYQIFSLRFWGSHQLNHFFCDIPPIVRLACGDTFMIAMLIYVLAVLIVTISFMLILGSHVKIISTIYKEIL